MIARVIRMTGAPDRMLFSSQIVAYLFLGGTGGGVLLASSIGSLRLSFKSRHMRPRDLQAFALLFRRCTVTGLVTLLVALLCLVGDLGHPDRLLYLFITPHVNVLTVGAYALGIELLLALGLLGCDYARVPRNSRIKHALQVVCTLFALIVMVYTGVYLYSLEAVAFWHHGALIATFLFSSLSSGISVTMLAAYFNPDQTVVLKSVQPLQRIHIAVLILEAVSIAALIYQAFVNPADAEAFATLSRVDVMPTAVIGVGVMALAAPLALESIALLSRRPRHIPASDVLCIVGCLMLRYVIVLCGAH